MLLIFDSICFWPSYYCVYRQSHPYKIMYNLCLSGPIEVKVGLLFENVLTGCIITESKCSRITQHLEFYTTRRRPILNHIIGEVNTIKVCT